MMTQLTQEDARPCAFCKSSELLKVELESGYERSYVVVCNCCGARGPKAGRVTCAVFLWNQSSIRRK